MVLAKKPTFFIVCFCLMLCNQAFAIHLGANDKGEPLPWSQPLAHPLDQPVNQKYNGKAFFMNLGPTGIRAIIEKDNPKAFKVMYVFQDSKSPAKGLVNIGDYIIGANGKQFRDDHGFHRKEGGRGWPGPPYELALAIEDSQGRDGKLSLLIKKGGPKGEKKTVVLQLKPVGRFSSTYPWNCPRSDKLRKELVDFLLDNDPTSGMQWIQIQRVLALWASGDQKAVSFAKDYGRKLTRSVKPNMLDTWMVSWNWGYQGIMLGEYYNLTKDPSAKSVIKELVQCYETGQTFSNGGFSHRPFPAIERRVAAGGPKGYGAMAGPGGLSMLAQSIFRENGLPYSQMAYLRTHEAYLMTAGGSNASGSIAYGFKGLRTSYIRLMDPKSPCKSKLGIGFHCDTGMKDIGDFKVEEWTQNGEKWDVKLVGSGSFPWPSTKWDKIHVYDLGKNRRLAVYPEPPDEPGRPYKNNREGGGHIAPVGMGALAHIISNTKNKSWMYLGDHMATCCAYSPKTLWDGHAAAEMHAFFGVLGAARADAKDFRHFLDYSKTWIILSESHDGEGLIDQPFGCQRNSTCSISRDRKAYTHVALLLLSLPNRNLLITGANSGSAPPPVVAGNGGGSTGGYTPRTSSTPAASTTGSRPLPQGFQAFQARRGPRKMSKANAERLEKALHKVLLTLSYRKTVKSGKMSISKFEEPVYIGNIYSDGTLSFKDQEGRESKKYTMKDLSSRDVSKLASLAVEISPANDLYALAGALNERAGRYGKASTFFKKAGEESAKKFDKFFDDGSTTP